MERALPIFLTAAVGTKLHGLCTGLVDRHGLLVNVTTTPLGGHPVLTVVVGRHSHADLCADGPYLALRHLALSYMASDPTRVRAFDLRAEAAVKCRNGNSVSATLAGLPSVFQLGSYLLLVAATPLVNRDGDALSSFGDYCEIDDDTPGTPFVFQLEDFRSRPMRSALRFSPSPILSACELGREPTVEVTGVRLGGLPAEHWFRPSAAELARGVLIGRYERCDAPASGMSWSEDMSRVHALLFSTGGGTYLCDAGSAFGVEHETLGKTRLKHIRGGDVFWLGSVRLSVVEAFS